MNDDSFHVTALMRKAIRPQDAAAGMRIFRTKAFLKLSGKTVAMMIGELNSGYQPSDFARSITCLQAVLPFFTRRGMVVELPGIGILYPVIKGKLMPGESQSMKAVKLTYTLRLDKTFEREIIRGLTCDFKEMVPAMPAPTVLEAGCWQDKGRTDFYPGQLVILRGTRMKYNEANPDEGLFLKSSATETIRIEHVDIKAKELLFQLPRTLVPGKKYTLIVRAKLYKCRDVREGSLPSYVVIGPE